MSSSFAGTIAIAYSQPWLSENSMRWVLVSTIVPIKPIGVWYFPVYLEDLSLGSLVLLDDFTFDRGLLDEDVKLVCVVGGEVEDGFEDASFMFTFAVIEV